MRFWPQSLLGQLALLLVLAALLAQLAGFLIFADERRSALEGFRREEIVGRIATVVELLEATPTTLHGSILRAASTAQTRLWIAPAAEIEAADGRLARRLRQRLERALGPRERTVLVDHRSAAFAIWRPWLDPDGDEAVRGGPGGPPRGRGRGHGGGPQQLAFAVELTDGSWLNARTELVPPPFPPATSATISTFATAAVILGAALLGVRRITRPLRALGLAADRLGRGEAVPALPVTGPREIRNATAAFNRMRERLQRFVADRTRMLAAIGHDLRTPITTLRLRAEFITDEESRTRILDSLDEMQRMVEATLTFTREEASREPTRLVDLAALVESVCSDLVDLGREVTLTAPQRLTLPCRPLGLKRAVRNLVLNAVTYGSRARVRVERSDAVVAVTVEDDGPGIAPGDLERVFEPFTRLEPSRSLATGGVGLGLAIARTIARAHGGDVRLENLPVGLRACLTLPLPAVA